VIRFYLDFISPYAYLGWTQIHAVAGRLGRDVEPIPVLFAGLLDARGARGPAEEPARRAYLIKDLVRRAHDFGVPFVLPPAHPFNPLLALRVASLPMDAGVRRVLVDRLFAAVWAGGGGVTDRDVVAAIAASAGVSPAALADAESPEGKARVRRQTDEALAQGAFGVPTAVVDGELFFGSDSLAHLDRFLAGRDPVTPDIVERWAHLPSSAPRQPR